MADLVALRPQHLPGFTTRRCRHPRRRSSDGVYWLPPPAGWLKLNVDGSSCGNPGMSGSGGLIRNSQGLWVDAFSVFIGTDKTAFQAEVWAIMYGMDLALRHIDGVTGIIIESDCKRAVDMINTWKIRPDHIVKLDEDPEFEGVVRDIKRILEELEEVCEVRVQHVPREGNNCADMLARKGSHQDESFPTSVLMRADYERQWIIDQLRYSPQPYAPRRIQLIPCLLIPPFGIWCPQP